jgi:hypothetical protein
MFHILNDYPQPIFLMVKDNTTLYMINQD